MVQQVLKNSMAKHVRADSDPEYGIQAPDPDTTLQKSLISIRKLTKGSRKKVHLLMARPIIGGRGKKATLNILYCMGAGL